MWDFGDQVTSRLVSPDHTYTQTGAYTVSLTAEGPGGGDTLTRTNYITTSASLPELVISKSGPITATAGQPLTYTLVVTNVGGASATNLVITDAIPADANYVGGGTRVGDVVSWTVALLANTASTQVSFVVTATQTITNSDYRVSADDDVSAEGQVAVVTAISQPPTADFSAEPLTGTVPLTVTFTDQSSGAVDSHLWDYGDGSTGTTSTLTHTHLYTLPGVYTATLTVSGLGGSDTLTRTGYITVTKSITPASGWWNDDFFYRMQMTLSVTEPVTYTPEVTTTLAITLDTTTLVDEDKLRADGSDLRVAYWDETSGWRELPRAVAGMDTPTTTLRFPLQTSIADTNYGYYVYYGNRVAKPPTWLDEAADARPGVSYGPEETPVVTATLEAAAGGTVTLAEGNLSLLVPAAAITQTLVVTHTPHQAVMDQGPDHLKRFELLASRPDGSPVEDFAAPITLTLSYAGLGIAPDAEESILFFYWDETAGDWQPITTTVNVTDDLASISVDHFSQFAVAQHFGLGGPPPLRRLPGVANAGVDLLTGAATYVYPLQVPPGTHGVQPNLSLVYNSGAADTLLDQQAGLVGHGFELAGLGWIQLDPDDEETYYLNLNGVSEKLIQEGETNRYRTQRETGWTVERLTGGQNGADDPYYWLVTVQDGTKRRFGYHLHSTAHYAHWMNDDPAYDRAYLFYLDQIQDVYSNTLTVSYAKESDEGSLSVPNLPELSYEYDLAVQPSVITYTTNSVAGANTPTRRLEFTYTTTYSSYTYIKENDESLTVRADFPAKQLKQERGPGQHYGYPQAMEAIRILVDDTDNAASDFALAREYRFGYTYYKQDDRLDEEEPYGPQYYHLMLADIAEYDGQDNYLPTTTLTYSSTGHLQMVSNGYGGQVEYEYQTIDYLVAYDFDYDYVCGTEGVDRWRVTTRTITSTLGEQPAAYHYAYAPAFDPGQDFRGHQAVTMTLPTGDLTTYTFSLGKYDPSGAYWGFCTTDETEEPKWGRPLQVTVVDAGQPLSTLETDYIVEETASGVHFVAPATITTTLAGASPTVITYTYNATTTQVTSIGEWGFAGDPNDGRVTTMDYAYTWAGIHTLPDRVQVWDESGGQKLAETDYDYAMQAGLIVWRIKLHAPRNFFGSNRIWFRRDCPGYRVTVRKISLNIHTSKHARVCSTRNTQRIYPYWINLDRHSPTNCLTRF